MNQDSSPLLQFHLEGNLSPLTLPENAKENCPPISRSLLKQHERVVKKDPLADIQKK